MTIDGERILVTGATGQVGRPIAEALAERNQVIGAARFRDADARAALHARDIETVQFELGQRELDHMPDVDRVIHCAADTAPGTIDAGFRANADGVGFLMERYRDVGGFFHMSTASVYQPKDGADAVYTEDDVLGGRSPYAPHYAASKLAGEAVARFQSRRLELPVVIGRLNVAYGNYGHGGLPMVLASMLDGGAPYQHAPHWDTRCSLIHTDDISVQVEALLDHAAVGATVVNLGGDEPVRLLDVIALLETLTGSTMARDEVAEPVWQTQILDPTMRRSLGGPCLVPWRDGVTDVFERRRAAR